MRGVLGSLDGPPVEINKGRAKRKPDLPSLARHIFGGLRSSGLSDSQIAEVIEHLPKSRQAIQRAKTRPEWSLGHPKVDDDDE
jgi:hypothetical protein